MDAPPIQYATTSDGVSIAYWTLGEGEPPLVYLFSPPFTHIEQEWHFPVLREWYQRVGTKRMLVRYDGRGSGMSERHVTDFSLEARLLDLQAVVERLALQRFALYGTASSGLTAITYAARHPERVSHLIVMDTYARGSDLYNVPQIRGLLGLLENDWETFTETFASVGFGWNAGDPARRFAALLRQCVTPQVARAYFAAEAELDLTDALSQISSPTLVIKRRGLPFPSMDTARATASRIPDARLVVREGTLLSPKGSEGLAQVVEEFLGEGELAETPEDSLPSGTAIILFLDIAGSTALTTQLGDAAYREKERDLDKSLRQAIREAGGSPVEGKVLGDGVMAVFASASNAIEAAQRCQSLGGGAGLPLHAGIHAGDVIREGNNVHGGAVQVAARIADASAPGEVLVSQTVRDLARTSAGVSFDDRGERELKGVSEPVRVFAVRGGE